MTIKDQADALVEKYRPYAHNLQPEFERTKSETYFATRCALESVKDTIYLLFSLHKPEYISFCFNGEVVDGYEMMARYELIREELESRL